MSRLVLDFKVPANYNKVPISDIIRAITTQVNLLSEGRIEARYSALESAPGSVAAQVSDIVWDSNATVQGTVGSQFVRIGWICTVASATAPTFQEMRVLTGT